MTVSFLAASLVKDSLAVAGFGRAHPEQIRKIDQNGID